MDPNKNPFFIEYFKFLKSSEEKSEFCLCSHKELLLPLTQLNRHFAACILQQTLDQLAISNEGKKKFQHFDQIQSMIERFKEKQREKIFDEKTLEPMYIALKRMIAIKLECDINEVRTALSDVADEITELGTCTALCRHMDRHHSIGLSETKLIQESICTEAELKRLLSQLKANKKHGKKTITNLNDSILDTEASVKELKIDNCIKYRLVCVWEKSRHEQAKRILQGDETKLIVATNELLVKIEREEKTIVEIENFVNHRIQTLQGLIQDWMSKYQADVSVLDDKIKTVQGHIAETCLKRSEIQKRYDAMHAEVEQYREEQRFLAEQREYEQELARKATRIQAWWRGMMVRHQLGPYRPKKKGKKGKK